jgi:hypothetical protein
MLGDKMGSDGFTHGVYTKTNKVFQVGEFLIGYTTSFRMGQLLQYYWTPPTKSSDITDDAYLYKVLVNSIKDLFKENDWGIKEKSEFQGGNFLFGWRGRLFEMQDNLSILELEKFGSVGCGEYHALAAMKTMELTGSYDRNPEKFLSTALTVAHSCVSGVSLEYDYLTEK